MRLLLLFLMLFPGVAWSQRIHPDINSVSPDHRWKMTAQWIEDTGYASQLENVKTGKVYLRDDKTLNNILPKEITISWSPDGHYLAATFYYGRAMEDVAVYSLTGEEPKDMVCPWNDPKISLETSLLHKEDRASYTGTGRSLISVNEWANNTDLMVDIDTRADLKNPKTGEKSTLNASYTLTVKLMGTNGKVTDTTCNSYGITPEAPSP
jgi:hypothetical protein